MFKFVLVIMLLFSEFQIVLLLNMNFPTELLRVTLILVVINPVERVKTLSCGTKW